MILSQKDFETIIKDQSKSISEDIAWQTSGNTYAMEFRVEVETRDCYPIFLKGWYNPYSWKLSYAIIHRGVGRIYGLDLGAEHRNPDGRLVGETHKNYWREGFRDKWAYSPEDVTEPWSRPIGVWEQFCKEARIAHKGQMSRPVDQWRLSI